LVLTAPRGHGRHADPAMQTWRDYLQQHCRAAGYSNSWCP